MSNRGMAIVTPSYEPDFELCRTLNRSVLEFLPSTVRHYIFVDRRDLALFRKLQNDRTQVVAKEEVLPRGFAQAPLSNRWFSRATLLPIHGWLVQQIAKIAAAELLDEQTLLMVDSDALFVRDVDPRFFIRNGRTRLYRSPRAITVKMQSHVAWHRNACRLLAVPSDAPPMDDYIGQVISWDRTVMRRMCAHIEAVSGTSWYAALARARRISEYLLYGLFAEKVPGMDDTVWLDERPRCITHWEFAPIPHGALVEFVRSLDEGDFAVAISSHSKTSREVRDAIIELATNGRLRNGSLETAKAMG